MKSSILVVLSHLKWMWLRLKHADGFDWFVLCAVVLSIALSASGQTPHLHNSDKPQVFRSICRHLVCYSLIFGEAPVLLAQIPDRIPQPLQWDAYIRPTIPPITLKETSEILQWFNEHPDYKCWAGGSYLGYTCIGSSSKAILSMPVEWVGSPPEEDPPCEFIPEGDCLPKPELVDVPAIQVAVEPSECFKTYDGCARVTDLDGNEITAHEWLMRDNDHARQFKWTCADKSRILLSSEDGKRHCVKF